MSDLFTLNWKDFLKGLVIAILTPAVLIIQQSIDLQVWTFNWKQISMAAIAGAVAYLLKNMLTNSEGKFLAKDDGLGGSQIPPKKDEK